MTLAGDWGALRDQTPTQRSLTQCGGGSAAAIGLRKSRFAYCHTAGQR